MAFETHVEILLGKHAFETGHLFFYQEQNMWFTREMIFFVLNIENFRKLGNQCHESENILLATFSDWFYFSTYILLALHSLHTLPFW